MELCNTDLHKLLQTKQILTTNHVKLFSYQLMRAVRVLHAANVVHRDLKPQNILIYKSSTDLLQLMLCDFGTGRFVGDEDQDKLRQTSLSCVTTAFYCAPEGILDKTAYSHSVDMWALGCIIAEMIQRAPLFHVRDLKQQLRMIVDICGKPDAEELKDFPDSSKKRFLIEYFSQCATEDPCMVGTGANGSCLTLTASGSIAEKLPPGVDEDALDLLQKLLVFHPGKRLTAAQAYEHPFLAPMNRGGSALVDVALFEERARNLAAEEWRDLLWEEVDIYQQQKKVLDVGLTSNENDLWGDL